MKMKIIRKGKIREIQQNINNNDNGSNNLIKIFSLIYMKIKIIKIIMDFQ